MDDYEIEILSEKISKAFLKLGGHPSHVDDCVQQVLIWFIERGKGQTATQAVIDYLRKDSKRKGNKTYNPNRFVGLKDKMLMGEAPTSKEDFAVYLSYLDNRLDKMMLSLFYVHGYSLKEIADMMLETKDNVAFFMCRIRKTILKKIVI